jgi:aminopeptidase N
VYLAGAAVVVTALGVVGVAHAGETGDPASTAGAAGVGDTLFPGLGNGGYDAESYDVRFDYHPTATTMPSSVTMRARATQALSRFNLDSVGQTISAVNVNGTPARFSSSGEELVITPAAPVGKGQVFTTTVRFTADRSKEPLSAAIPIPEWHNWIKTPDGFAMLGQPDRAHLFFPCNDHPSDKARFTFRVSVPDGLTAVANGALAERRSAAGRTTFVYRGARPMATHVTQVAVGKFTVVEGKSPGGVPLRSVVPTDKVDQVRPALDRVGGQVDFMARTLGRPYPFESYGILGVDSVYNGVALEAQTLSTYSIAGLIESGTGPSGIELHELAHQYFGNAVSVARWQDMWLSEGHASYYDRFDMRPGHEGPGSEETMRQVYARAAEERESFGPPGAPKAHNVLMGTNSLGALTLYALYQQLGPTTFHAVEQAFLDRYRDRSATTQDYIDTVNDVSGQDLTGMLNAWLYGPTTPPMPNHPDWKTDPPSND